MARKERVLAEAAESKQRKKQSLWGKVMRKFVEWDKQEALFEWDPGLNREAICLEMHVAAELFHACEEEHSYVYLSTSTFFFWIYKGNFSRKVERRWRGRWRVLAEVKLSDCVWGTHYRGGRLVLGDPCCRSLLLFFRAYPEIWQAQLAWGAPRTQGTCGRGWLGYLRRWAPCPGCIVCSFGHQNTQTRGGEGISPHGEGPALLCALGLPGCEGWGLIFCRCCSHPTRFSEETSRQELAAVVSGTGNNMEVIDTVFHWEDGMFLKHFTRHCPLHCAQPSCGTGFHKVYH